MQCKIELSPSWICRAPFTTLHEVSFDVHYTKLVMYIFSASLLRVGIPDAILVHNPYHQDYVVACLCLVASYTCASIQKHVSSQHGTTSEFPLLAGQAYTKAPLTDRAVVLTLTRKPQKTRNFFISFQHLEQTAACQHTWAAQNAFLES